MPETLQAKITPSEPSNKRLIILLVILVGVLLVLIGQWQWGEKNGPMATTTATGVSKVLTEAEKADVVQSLRFATPASSTQPSVQVANEKIQEASDGLRISNTKPAPLGIKEMQDVLKGL
jgi:hypothetical protein